MTMRSVLVGSLVGIAGILAVSTSGPAEAQTQTPITCGEFYDVLPGDTLREIALRAYGVGSYQLIFSANQDILRTPSLLLVGQRLFIPCPDGVGPSTRQEAAAATQPAPLAPDVAGQAEQPGNATGETQVAAAPDPSTFEIGVQPIQPPVGATAATAPAAAATSVPTSEPGVQPIQPAPQATGGSSSQSATLVARLRPQATLQPQPQPAPVQPLPRQLPQTEPEPQPLPGATLQPALQGGTQQATAEELAAAATGFNRTMRFLTGSQFPPFTDEDLPEGGMITELIKIALDRSAPNRDYRITFVNDWGPHLSVLLPDGAFDLGFPWYRPDCSKIGKLSDGMRKRCTDYDFSRPLYEVVVGYYARQDDPLVGAVDYSGMAGRRICRPRGYFTFDLEVEDLVEPNITMFTPQTPLDCFQMLADGEVDVVTINILVAEDSIKTLGLAAQIVELPDLATIQTLHVITPKTNPYGRGYLTLLNRGIRQMRESGEWFQVVSRHLADHAKRTASN